MHEHLSTGGRLLYYHVCKVKVCELVVEQKAFAEPSYTRTTSVTKPETTDD